eukprot:TRINITY_DN2635_c0_g1_i1.p1 TRINITY_DN2635_c0_g1~~TRINITY_DN2635_c0_g1_i1.p1  ORF type:complete len:274 (-),score=78.82 TRINITY_DN2635_c0_g1_i1:896-1717(-)
MADQSLGHGEIVNVRWANEDPNPAVKNKGEKDSQEKAFDVMIQKHADTLMWEYTANQQYEAKHGSLPDYQVYPNTDYQYYGEAPAPSIEDIAKDVERQSVGQAVSGENAVTTSEYQPVDYSQYYYQQPSATQPTSDGTATAASTDPAALYSQYYQAYYQYYYQQQQQQNTTPQGADSSPAQEVVSTQTHETSSPSVPSPSKTPSSASTSQTSSQQHKEEPKKQDNSKKRKDTGFNIDTELDSLKDQLLSDLSSTSASVTDESTQSKKSKSSPK